MAQTRTRARPHARTHTHMRARTHACAGARTHTRTHTHSQLYIKRPRCQREGPHGGITRARARTHGHIHAQGPHCHRDGPCAQAGMGSRPHSGLPARAAAESRAYRHATRTRTRMPRSARPHTEFRIQVKSARQRRGSESEQRNSSWPLGLGPSRLPRQTSLVMSARLWFRQSRSRFSWNAFK